MTLQVAVALALLGRVPRWRGVVALFSPLGVYWALKERMYIRASLWAVSAVAYAVLLVLAYI
jgi:hypothetical protein